MIKVVYITLVIVSNMVDKGRIILQNLGPCNLSMPLCHDYEHIISSWTEMTGGHFVLLVKLKRIYKNMCKVDQYLNDLVGK